MNPEAGLITDFFPCSAGTPISLFGGHAQERRLLGRVVGQIEPGELWIADRNFATQGFLSGIAERGACVLIREHGNLPWEAVGLEEEKGRAENGDLYEQPIRIPGNGEDEGESALEERRIRLLLDEPTRDGDTEIVVLTSLPEEAFPKKTRRPRRSPYFPGGARRSNEPFRSCPITWKRRPVRSATRRRRCLALRSDQPATTCCRS